MPKRKPLKTMQYDEFTDAHSSVHNDGLEFRPVSKRNLHQESARRARDDNLGTDADRNGAKLSRSSENNYRRDITRRSCINNSDSEAEENSVMPQFPLRKDSRWGNARHARASDTDSAADENIKLTSGKTNCRGNMRRNRVGLTHRQYSCESDSDEDETSGVNRCRSHRVKDRAMYAEDDVKPYSKQAKRNSSEEDLSSADGKQQHEHRFNGDGRRQRGNDHRRYHRFSSSEKSGNRHTRTRKTKGHMKPEKYDGNSCFETFLVQFNNCAQFNIRYDTIRDAILTCARKPT